MSMLSPLNNSGVAPFSSGGQEPVTQAVSNLEPQSNAASSSIASDGFTGTNSVVPQSLVSQMGMSSYGAPWSGPQQPVNTLQVQEFTGFLEGLLMGLLMGVLRAKREAALGSAASSQNQAVAPAGVNTEANPATNVNVASAGNGSAVNNA